MIVSIEHFYHANEFNLDPKVLQPLSRVEFQGHLWQ